MVIISAKLAPSSTCALPETWRLAMCGCWTAPTGPKVSTCTAKSSENDQEICWLSSSEMHKRTFELLRVSMDLHGLGP